MKNVAAREVLHFENYNEEPTFVDNNTMDISYSENVEHPFDGSEDGSINEDEQTENYSSDSDEDIESQGENLSSYKYSLLEILQHFAVYSGQKQEDMTYLLKLLKYYEPAPHYSSLPSTGQQLLKIDGFDWPSDRDGQTKKLPQPVSLGGGKYLHFGLENALMGNSPGIVHRNADLLQFVDVYMESPHLVPESVRKKVFCFEIYRVIAKS